MADTDWLMPTTATGDSDLGSEIDGNASAPADEIWTNPTNITNDGTSEATRNLSNASKITDSLDAGGFNFSSIPPGATIDGIKVEIQRWQTGSGCKDNAVHIFTTTKGLSTSNKANATVWPGTETPREYGTGETDKWGETWTRADLEDGFKIVMNTIGGSSGVARVDTMRVKIFFTPQFLGGMVPFMY